MSHQTEVEKYVKDINDHVIISGQYCQKSVKRFIHDIEAQSRNDWPYIFDAEQADSVIDFAESLIIPDITGPDRHLKLMSWHKFVYYNLFGWVYKSDSGRRRFRDGYIEVARKNSKTTSLLFPIVLYDFLTTNAAEAYFFEADLAQAEKSYKELNGIIKADSDLSQACESTSMAITCKNSRISFFCDGTESVDSYKNSCTIIDEYHDFKSDHAVTASRYGGRARKNSLVLKITSAGNDISGPCYAENQAARKVLDGIITNEQYFSLIYAYDEGDDWKNPELFKKANPSLNEIPTLKTETLQGDLLDALQKPTHQPDFISKTCGIWTTSQSSWIPLHIFEAEQPENIDYMPMKKIISCGAIDLSSVNDFTAFSLAFPVDGLFFMRHFFYVPEETVALRYSQENINILNWIDRGIVTVIPGPIQDEAFIVRDIVELIHQGYKINSIYYDPWQSTRIINLLADVLPDLIMVPFIQNLKNMSPATKEYEKLVFSHKIKDANPCLKWMMGNVVTNPNVNGDYKPLKENKDSHRRIDGVITSIMSVRAVQDMAGNGGTPACSSFKELFNSF